MSFVFLTGFRKVLFLVPRSHSENRCPAERHVASHIADPGKKENVCSHLEGNPRQGGDWRAEIGSARKFMRGEHEDLRSDSSTYMFKKAILHPPS